MSKLTRTELACWGVVAMTSFVHVLALLPFVRVELSTVLPLVFPPMATFVLMVLRLIPFGREHLDACLAAAPRWVKRGYWGTFAYAFLTSVSHTASYRGTPKIVDSAFVLSDHGKVLRTITEAEYWDLARSDVAFVFGFMLVFAYWGAAGYTFARKPILD